MGQAQLAYKFIPMKLLVNIMNYTIKIYIVIILISKILISIR